MKKIIDITLLPEINNIDESKTVKITEILENWIKENLKLNNIKASYLMPSKAELAKFYEVSIGTIQTVYRTLEDRGLVQSKQCIGTMISNIEAPRKSTSKRDLAIELIKKFIKINNFKSGDILPSARAISKFIDTPANTTRLALENLVINGIIEKTEDKEQNWILKSLDFSINIDDNGTLIKKIESDLKKYITNNLKVGDKMPTHDELSKSLKVSVKTIHDGLNILVQNGILMTRRGRYGTSVIKMPNENNLQPKKEFSIFATAQQTAFYHYERIENNIKKLITDNYGIGSKLPSIVELSAMMDVSPNTIRKAFSNLAKDGYLRFSRGRYGGTFVLDIPESNETQVFKWLAVNPKYAVYKN